MYPNPDEYGAFYAGYIARLPASADVWAVLGQQLDELPGALAGVDEARAEQPPAPGEWSFKEILGHIIDTERIFAYRALCLARGEQAALPGFDQDAYVRAAHFNTRPLCDLLEEFALVRRANLLAFRGLSAAEAQRLGTASGQPVSVRALLWMMAGHVEHHLESLREQLGG